MKPPTANKTSIGRSWLILFVLGVLIALSSLGILFAGVDADEFQASTGTTWSDFAARELLVATYIARLVRLVGVIDFAFALFGAVVSFAAFRQGYRWAWYAMWLFPITLAACSAVFISHGAPGLAVYYGAITTVALVGMMLPIRRFFERG